MVESREMDALTRQAELAKFLRSRRERLKPDSVGLPDHGRRRTPGLRREEVALLAGIGVDWYTRLEQGRDIRVSDQVLDSIAHVLQLDTAERKHLYMLAFGHHPPPATTALDIVGPTLQSFLNHQNPIPAFVLGYRWDILAWNTSAAFLLGDLWAMNTDERNLIWKVFVELEFRHRLVDWESHAKRLLAQFRVSFGQYIEDPGYQELVKRLCNTSPEFGEWWGQHDVMSRQDAFKEYHHPIAGQLLIKQTTMLVSDEPGLKVVLWLPLPSSDTLEKLQQMQNKIT